MTDKEQWFLGKWILGLGGDWQGVVRSMHRGHVIKDADKDLFPGGPSAEILIRVVKNSITHDPRAFHDMVEKARRG